MYVRGVMQVGGSRLGSRVAVATLQCQMYVTVTTPTIILSCD